MSKMGSPALTRQASGSEEDPRLAVDQRKRKRMLSNRESARRSRMRKQQHLDDLISQAALLKDENSRISTQVDLFTQQYIGVESENSILRTRLLGLAERLQSLNSVLRFVEASSGVAVDIPEIPDQLLNPWQLPCLAQAIMASADGFQR